MQTRTQSTITIVACQLHPDNEWGIVVEDTIEGGVPSLDLCQVLLAETAKKKHPRIKRRQSQWLTLRLESAWCIKNNHWFLDCLVTNTN